MKWRNPGKAGQRREKTPGRNEHIQRQGESREREVLPEREVKRNTKGKSVNTTGGGRAEEKSSSARIAYFRLIARKNQKNMNHMRATRQRSMLGRAGG